MPYKKSIGVHLKISNVYKAMKAKEQPYLYVAHQHAKDVGVSDTFLLTDDERCVYICGDYFCCSDFEPYEENKKEN